MPESEKAARQIWEIAMALVARGEDELRTALFKATEIHFSLADQRVPGQPTLVFSDERGRLDLDVATDGSLLLRVRKTR